MFPLPWNKAYRKKDGTLVTVDEAISEGGGGGGGYTLPTASAETKGGIKVGSGLTITGETLSADAQLPAYTSSESGKVLSVSNEGTLVWSTVSGGVNRYNESDSEVSVNVTSFVEEVST